MSKLIGILDFAYKLGFTNLYDWQERCLLRYAGGDPTALAACNYSGKTSTIFVIAALWPLYNFPRARVLYVSATFPQVRLQFFQSIKRFSDHPLFKNWDWLDTEIHHPEGGKIFGRAPGGEGGNIEGAHDEVGSPAALLIDEAKSVHDDVLDALSRCTTTFRLFASSTGRAYGEFYRICTTNAHLWKMFRVTSNDCPHIPVAKIQEDRLHLRDSVYRIKHSCEWLFDDGTSIISLEHLRRLLANQSVSRAVPMVTPERKLTPEELERETYHRCFVAPPRLDPNEPIKRRESPKRITAFCDFAAGGECESTLGICEDTEARVEAFTKDPDCMSVVGWFISHFKRLRLSSFQIGADEGGVGRVYLARFAEQGYYLQPFNNGRSAKDDEHFFNLAAEQWSIVAELIELQLITIRNCDETLVKQLCSRQKFYDSYGRTKLQPKSEMSESPDRADCLIGAICMGIGSDPFATRPVAKEQMRKELASCVEAMRRRSEKNGFGSGWIDFSGM